ncbi:hypothetical protein EON77_00395 [bacterium]|nr:MAG: hypothetical protein EON77_00395 [bacterium]
MKTLLRFALGSLFAGATAAAFAAAQLELLVKYAPNATPTLLNAGIGAKTLASYPQIGWQKIQVPGGMTKERAIRYYKSLSSVVAVEERTKPVAYLIPNDPLYGQSSGNVYKQYQHAQINMPSAWELSIGSPNVTVAVVDSGSRPTHEDLVGQILSTSRNFTSGGTASDISDGDGHGTHVSGLAAATGNNGKGGLGTGWNVKLLTCKITYGTSGTEDFANAIMYAADQGAKVINMSFGSRGYSQMLDEAVQYAFNKDVVMVAAAGNDNETSARYPASLPNVLTVASTDQGSGRSSFSNYGPLVDVAAPGGEIVSTATTGDSDYIVESGTSMASPVTAGAVALMRAYAPDAPGTEIVTALISTARQASTPFTVYGQIDVAAAMRAIAIPVVTGLKPGAAAIVNNEGVISNTTGAPATDASYLSTTDGSTLNIRSNYQASLGTVAGFTTTFATSTTAPDLTKLLTGRLQMTLRANTNVTALVMMLNTTTNSWDLVNSTRLTSTDQTINLALPRPTIKQYINSAGNVTVRVRAINPSRLAPGGAPFTANIDSANLILTVNSR